VADEENLDEYACPNCDATVEPDWAACPNCGVEFAPAEEEVAPPPAAPSAARPPAAAAPAAEEEQGDEPEAEDLFSDLDALEKEIEAAAPAAPPAVKPPAAAGGGAPARAAAATGPPLARLGGLLGSLGVVLLGGGALGALVALNWDTWVAGAPVNTVGGIQQMAILGMALAALAGVALFMIARRKGQAA
jgi:hypothetical protein